MTEWQAKNADIYENLIDVCESIVELKFRLQVLNQQWTQWDWMFFFELTISRFHFNDRVKILYQDILQEIETGSELDGVISNTAVIRFLSTPPRTGT